MSGLMPFQYDGQQIRTAIVNGEPAWIAKDLCDVLGISKYRDAVAQLDEDERVSIAVDTPGGKQSMIGVTEAGVWSLMLISRSPQVKPFTRWLTHEVLPQLRKTGTYSAVALPQTPAERMAAAVLEAQSIIDQLSGRVAELEPSAKAWDELADATGDYDSRAAAQILARAGVDMGQNRLRTYLRQIEWTDRNNRPYQRHVQAGRVSEKVRRWEDRETGEVHVDHQLRITAKGVGELLAKLTSGTLQVIAGGAS